MSIDFEKVNLNMMIKDLRSEREELLKQRNFLRTENEKLRKDNNTCRREMIASKAILCNTEKENEKLKVKLEKAIEGLEYYDGLAEHEWREDRGKMAHSILSQIKRSKYV